MRFVHFLLAAALAVPALAAADPAFSQAQAVFLKAADGNSAAVEEAVRQFTRLAAVESDQAPLLLAYLGAAQTMQGRDAWLPWEKVRATERGLAVLDKALRSLEARHDTEIFNGTAISLETRLVAANTFLSLPSLFNRFDAGKQALREAFAHPGWAAAPGEVRARLHRLAAQVAAHDGKRSEEREHLKQAADLAQAAPTGATAG
ncbi:MAG: hypothetical protein KGZ83_21015, partial [Sulfuricella sp.]|nr:hypothetical protein [Sulfuricella sp.]